MIAKPMNHLIVSRLQAIRVQVYNKLPCDFTELVVQHIITTYHLKVPACHSIEFSSQGVTNMCMGQLQRIGNAPRLD